MTPEGKVKEQIKQLLARRQITAAKDAGKDQPTQGWYYMPGQTGLGVRGIPDFVGHFQGRFFAIEAKAPGKAPQGFQALQIAEINRSARVVFVVDGPASLQEFEAWLERGERDNW